MILVVQTLGEFFFAPEEFKRIGFRREASTRNGKMSTLKRMNIHYAAFDVRERAYFLHVKRTPGYIIFRMGFVTRAVGE